MKALEFVVLLLTLVAAAQTFRPRVIQDSGPVVPAESWPLAADRRAR